MVSYPSHLLKEINDGKPGAVEDLAPSVRPDGLLAIELIQGGLKKG